MSSRDRSDGARGGTGRGRELALNLGALAGLVCIVAAAVSMFFGVMPLVFRSGSMSPEIPTGALALAVPVAAADLAAGDVVSVVTPGDVRITHRVTGLAPAGDGTVAVTLRGDANDADDPAPYLLREADRVFFHVDGLGYPVAWLSNPVAIFLGGMLAGALCVIAFGRARGTDDEGYSQNHDTTDPVDAVHEGVTERTHHV
ncbi:signal peptidase I [Rhodococcus sp. IEGM 1408]|uniref:signal peptidase I n=1 Tax=Rhodococcus sp. IEGM 1408 TaxID=3082220 RepID=UPI002954D917|nr:signal peptidase I [Rhodococcus sp. IEGM 1408]MDV8002470.1 signal peptidase I [Rhodococcus sp. IEGM 1408]